MHRYTEAQKEFIKKASPGRYNDEITNLFNQEFGTSLSVCQIRSFKAKHKIKSNVPRNRVKPDSGLFTKEQKEFIKANVKGVLNRELAELVNEKFNLTITAQQMLTYKKNHGLTSGVNTQFKRGQEAWNKGIKGLDLAGENGKKTQFKKGDQPQNYRPVGSERIDSRDGYTLIKVKDEGLYQDRWRHKHVVVWEKENGPVPYGCVIVFADGDKRNIEMSNLLLITRNELVRMNQQELFSSDSKLTKAALTMIRLGNKVIDHELYGGDRDEFQKHIETAKKNGLSEQTFITRLKRGWALSDALYKPLHSRPYGRKVKS
ncbi:hypothetical protein JNUCC1_03331 [Lentibacillus sp. JNUCC-1]|uniref:HNH endonuclease signature motif containing protein n=1 Tax=Lentibacillus sp. JNUCC-1 TaxID=2654513 RepID=UPI0012E73BD2|nr:HNH endonuclease signature motif containing protein [Lentibacillus sp. JNUCC-1]MUV39453.1 hypothetical protein [Lentibacillus sp. JNUCC-1]